MHSAFQPSSSPTLPNTKTKAKSKKQKAKSKKQLSSVSTDGRHGSCR
jgi:hypothetical protein